MEATKLSICSGWLILIRSEGITTLDLDQLEVIRGTAMHHSKTPQFRSDQMFGGEI